MHSHARACPRLTWRDAGLVAWPGRTAGPGGLPAREDCLPGRTAGPGGLPAREDCRPGRTASPGGLPARGRAEGVAGRQVRGVESLLELAGAQLALGVAGRREQSLREEAVLRRLRGERAVVVLDDWHALPAAARADVARLVGAFPPNVRVIITTRGATGSAAARELRRALPAALSLAVPGLASGPAQRIFYLHMMRCVWPPDHRGAPWPPPKTD
jgi:hypothetical protein